jgi:hypothetical protein
VSPERWTSPRVLKLRKLCQNLRSPQAQKMCKALLLPVVLRPLPPVPPQATTLRVLLQAQSQLSPPKHLHQALGPMDSGLPLGTKLATAHLCLGLKSHRNSTHGRRVSVGQPKIYPGRIPRRAVHNGRENIKAFCTSLKSTSAQIDVSA